MKVLFNGSDVTGELNIAAENGVLSDDDQNAVLMLICALTRRIALSQVESAIRRTQRAGTLGPLVNPEAWEHNAFTVHNANLDVLRRFEDLRRALIEVDTITGRDPYAQQLEVSPHGTKPTH